MPDRETETFKFRTVTHKEIENIIDNLKRKNSSGFNNISNNLVRSVQKDISLPLLDIINMSLITGTVSSRWKTAKVIPLHKGGEKTDLNNYRPISLLPVF